MKKCYHEKLVQDIVAARHSEDFWASPSNYRPRKPFIAAEISKEGWENYFKNIYGHMVIHELQSSNQDIGSSVDFPVTPNSFHNALKKLSNNKSPAADL